jgi:spermidine synthase
MEPWIDLAEAQTVGGDRLVLRERAGVFEIRCNGWELMSNRSHHSETVMAHLACERVKGVAPVVLIGGLGMGYTLRAALDSLSAQSRVVVAEVLAEVVAWNRGPLGPLAGCPLDDPRVEIADGDVVSLLTAPGDGFDGIILDVDNGPDALSVASNRRLYDGAGIALIGKALRPGGVLAVWSADRSPAFEAAMTAAGLRWNVFAVPARGTRGDPEHAIYLAEGPGRSAQASSAAIV